MLLHRYKRISNGVEILIDGISTECDYFAIMRSCEEAGSRFSPLRISHYSP